MKREQRKVKPDGTISLDKRLYEVPSRFISQSIDVRMDDKGVYFFENDRKVAEVTLVSLKDTAHVKRSCSPFSLSQTAIIQEEQDHV